MLAVELFKTFSAVSERFTIENLRYLLNTSLTWSIFELEKWVRIVPNIYWYHYQGAIPAPMEIVRHETKLTTPTR